MFGIGIYSCAFLHQNRDWTSSPTFREELIEALEKASPTKFYGDVCPSVPATSSYSKMDFWRIIMRRNHTFRPVSNVMKTYRENFYAVFAIKIVSTTFFLLSLFFDG